MKLGRERRVSLYLLGEYGQFWKPEDYIHIGEAASEFRRGWDRAEAIDKENRELDNIAMGITYLTPVDKNNEK